MSQLHVAYCDIFVKSIICIKLETRENGNISGIAVLIQLTSQSPFYEAPECSQTHQSPQFLHNNCHVSGAFQSKLE